jgi:hypothetical protein
MQVYNPEAVLFQSLAANSNTFLLKGGKYAVAAVATFGGGSVKLQVLGPDLSTFLSVAGATDFSAAGFATVDLPPGQYRFTIATATAVYASVIPVPLSPAFETITNIARQY